MARPLPSSAVDLFKAAIKWRENLEKNQKRPQISVYTDTDYVGCKRTRKHTSGGVMQLGKHTVKTWSTTQSVIALSSGEAEYYGLVKGGSVGLGMQRMLKDLGIDIFSYIDTTLDKYSEKHHRPNRL